MRRWLPLIGGAAALAILVGYLVVWTGVSPTRQRGSDFSVDYVAALLLREGHGAALYDQGVEAARHATLLPEGTVFNLPYIGPPTAALLTVPFTAADPQTAYRAFALLQLATLAAAIAVAARASPWGTRVGRDRRMAVCLVAAATPATLVLVLMAQWDGLLALALAVGYAALGTRRPLVAGVVLGAAFAATKPHLAIGLAAFVVGRREWRAAAGAAAAAAAVGLLSLATVGSAGLAGFVASISGAFANTAPQSTVGLAGLVSSWLGSGPLTAGLVVAGSLLALASCALLGRASSRRPDLLAPSFAGAVALSLLLAPHVLAHDVVLLVPGFIVATAWHTRRGGDVVPPLAAWMCLSCLVAVDAGNSAAAPPGRLVPVALAAAGVIALMARRRPAAAPRAAATAA